MSDSGGSVSDTPINKTVDGQQHQLAYITPEEAQNLVDQGGQPTMTNEGVMAYPPWDDPGASPGTPHTGHQPSNQGGGGSPSIGTSLHQGPTVKETFQKIEAQKLPTGHPEWQAKEAQKTVKPTDTLTTTFKTTGRPDITYKAPSDTLFGKYNSKAELRHIKYIQDTKLNSIKGKLKIAGFTDLPKDATFEETKTYIDKLSRTGKILDSWENATDKHGKPLYDQTTIDKWKASGRIPQSQAMKSYGMLGMAMNVIGGAPLSRDQLMADFNQIEEVGKSGGGAMDWQTRMKTFSPGQWAGSTGQTYDPNTKTFSGGGNEQAAVERIASPYQVGGTAPQVSQAAKWYANLGNTGTNQFQFSFANELATAKAKQASILGNPSAIGQLAVNQSPYYDFLKKNKLDRGIL